MPTDTTRAGTPVWFGGGRLAADLTLPKLRRRWDPARSSAADLFTPAERNAIWDHAARVAAEAAGRIRHLATADPAAAADAAWAAAYTLRVAASALRSRVVRQATDSFDRAARAPYGRTPRPTPTGNSLRRAARLLATAASVDGDPVLAQVTLVVRLVELAEAVADLREAQRHAAQAAAARRTAEHLHAARGTYVIPAAKQRARTRTAAERVRLEFPFPPGTIPAAGSPASRRSAHLGARPSPPRPRGPTR